MDKARNSAIVSYHLQKPL